MLDYYRSKFLNNIKEVENEYEVVKQTNNKNEINHLRDFYKKINNQFHEYLVSRVRLCKKLTDCLDNNKFKIIEKIDFFYCHDFMMSFVVPENVVCANLFKNNEIKDYVCLPFKEYICIQEKQYEDFNNDWTLINEILNEEDFSQDCADFIFSYEIIPA